MPRAGPRRDVECRHLARYRFGAQRTRQPGSPAAAS